NVSWRKLSPTRSTPARTRSRRRETHSFEYLHQRPLIALLDSVDPLVFIQQIENVDGQALLLEIQVHPNRTGRCRDDHAKSRKTMWVGHVQRNVDGACADVAFSDQAENDASNADVRPHDVDEHHRHQCEEPIAAANGGLQWPQRRGGEQQQRGHDRAEHDMAERDSAVHQQPHDDQHDEEDRGDAPHHAPPASATVSGSVASTASMYVCGDINPSAAACKNAMTGSAAIVKPTQSSTSTATGAASITRRRGVLRPTTLQNSRIPIRVN